MSDFPKKKYTTLGVMTKNKPYPDEAADAPPRFSIKLEQQKNKDKTPYGEVIFPITLANGKVLNDGDYLVMFAKKPKFQAAVEAGSMTQETADQLASFLLFDICVAESVDEGQAAPAPKKKKTEVPF